MHIDSETVKNIYSIGLRGENAFLVQIPKKIQKFQKQISTAPLTIDVS